MIIYYRIRQKAYQRTYITQSLLQILSCNVEGPALTESCFFSKILPETFIAKAYFVSLMNIFMIQKVSMKLWLWIWIMNIILFWKSCVILALFCHQFTVVKRSTRIFPPNVGSVIWFWFLMYTNQSHIKMSINPLGL